MYSIRGLKASCERCSSVLQKGKGPASSRLHLPTSWAAGLNPGVMLVRNIKRTRDFFRSVRLLTEDEDALSQVRLCRSAQLDVLTLGTPCRTSTSGQKLQKAIALPTGISSSALPVKMVLCF